MSRALTPLTQFSVKTLSRNLALFSCRNSTKLLTLLTYWNELHTKTMRHYRNYTNTSISIGASLVVNCLFTSVDCVDFARIGIIKSGPYYGVWTKSKLLFWWRVNGVTARLVRVVEKNFNFKWAEEPKKPAYKMSCWPECTFIHLLGGGERSLWSSSVWEWLEIYTAPVRTGRFVSLTCKFGWMW